MKLDDVKKLHQKKYRTELGFYLVEGEHLILELEKAAQHTHAFTATKLYVTDVYQGWSSCFEKVLVSAKQMQQISDTKSPQGIVAVVPLNASAHSSLPLSANEKVIYLYEVQDPGNLGTILRTLAWFGNFRCVLSPNSVDPFNPKVVRASMGAIFHLCIEQDVAIQTLAQRYARFAYLDLQGEDVSCSQFVQNECFIFGNEARGVPHDLLSELDAKAYSIKGSGAIESLNLASAVNMCAYELNRR